MLNPPIGNERHGLAYRAPGLANCLQLGYACRRFEPGAAAAARANADLDTIDAQRLQEARSFCGPNIATDQGCCLKPLPKLSTACCMTFEWPWATSIRMTSAPARTSSAARSR